MKVRMTNYYAIDIDDKFTAIIKDRGAEEVEEVQLIYNHKGERQRIPLTPHRCKQLVKILGMVE